MTHIVGGVGTHENLVLLVGPQRPTDKSAVKRLVAKFHLRWHPTVEPRRYPRAAVCAGCPQLQVSQYTTSVQHCCNSSVESLGHQPHTHTHIC